MFRFEPFITAHAHVFDCNTLDNGEAMGKDDDELEYYKAKQSVGQLPVTKPEPKKPVKPSAKHDSLRATSTGYVPMNETPEKTADFERYQEITFAQKASDRAKRNPLIP